MPPAPEPLVQPAEGVFLHGEIELVGGVVESGHQVVGGALRAPDFAQAIERVPDGGQREKRVAVATEEHHGFGAGEAGDIRVVELRREPRVQHGEGRLPGGLVVARHEQAALGGHPADGDTGGDTVGERGELPGAVATDGQAHRGDARGVNAGQTGGEFGGAEVLVAISPAQEEPSWNRLAASACCWS